MEESILDRLNRVQATPSLRMYRSSMYRDGLVDNKDMNLEGFLKMTFASKNPVEWKSSILSKENVKALLNIVNERRVRVPSGVINLNCVSQICMFLPMSVEKQVFSRGQVKGWREAEKQGVMKSYFAKVDKFSFFEGESDEYDYVYMGDYYDCVLSVVNIEERVRKYRVWLAANATDVKVKENTFGSPLTFAYNFERNMSEQLRVYSELGLDRLNIIGDGAGSGSVAAISMSLDYVSSENNKIGLEAISLGIVSTITDSNKEFDRVLVCSNVVNYFKEGEWDYYFSNYDRIVVIEEDRTFKNKEKFTQIPMTFGKVWVKGIVVSDPIKLNPLARSYNYLQLREPVCPIDEKSRIYVEGIAKSDEGLRVSSDDIEGAFNMRTLNYPGNLDYARTGQVKMKRGCKFKYYSVGQVVVFPGEVFKYYPNDLDNPSSYSGQVRRDGDYYIIRVKNPRRIRFILYDDMAVRVYYIKTVKSAISESYYRDSAMNVQTEICD